MLKRADELTENDVIIETSTETFPFPTEFSLRIHTIEREEEMVRVTFSSGYQFSYEPQEEVTVQGP